MATSLMLANRFYRGFPQFRDSSVGDGIVFKLVRPLLYSPYIT